MENIIGLVDELEREILGSKRAVLSGNRIVEEARIMDIINAIRDCLPSAMMEANAILRDRNEVQDNAKRQANDIIKEARDKAESYVMESEIVRRASNDADAIIYDARMRKESLLRETGAALEDLFKTAELTLGEILQDIRDSRDGMHEEMNKHMR